MVSLRKMRGVVVGLTVIAGILHPVTVDAKLLAGTKGKEGKGGKDDKTETDKNEKNKMNTRNQGGKASPSPVKTAVANSSNTKNTSRESRQVVTHKQNSGVDDVPVRHGSDDVIGFGAHTKAAGKDAMDKNAMDNSDNNDDNMPPPPPQNLPLSQRKSNVKSQTNLLHDNNIHQNRQSNPQLIN
jgi:hypothetical protein